VLGKKTRQVHVTRGFEKSKIKISIALEKLTSSWSEPLTWLRSTVLGYCYYGKIFTDLFG